MIKLALVGKHIQHSRSPEIYRKLLGDDIEYELLDYENASLIPSAEELLKAHSGISITSPYKRHFLNAVELTPDALELGAINCLVYRDGKIFGENTDFLAIREILDRYKKSFENIDVIVLGDGAMSKVTQRALGQLGIQYKVLSRRTVVDGFDQINLEEEFQKFPLRSSKKMAINSCSRDFVFKGHIGKETIFWDYNYNFLPHSTALPLKTNHYIDGIEMLDLQARHALLFWSINRS
ncbi:MAG: shikimate dehydrogenase family protein [Bacteriovorax sp.]